MLPILLAPQVLVGGALVLGLGQADTVNDSHGPTAGGAIVGVNGTAMVAFTSWFRAGGDVGYASLFGEHPAHALTVVGRVAFRIPANEDGVLIGVGYGWGTAFFPSDRFQTSGGALRFSGNLVELRMGFEHARTDRLRLTIDLTARISVPGEFAWESQNGVDYWGNANQFFGTATLNAGVSYRL